MRMNLAKFICIYFRAMLETLNPTKFTSIVHEYKLTFLPILSVSFLP